MTDIDKNIDIQGSWKHSDKTDNEELIKTYFTVSFNNWKSNK